MNFSHLNRREALKTLGTLTAAVAVSPALGRAQGAPQGAVKWSAGTERPRLKVPPNATDCHHHIYDARFPAIPGALLKPEDALVADYRALQARLGTTRNVVIQPSTYGTDNRLLVECIAAFGLKTSRGVAVVNTEVTDAELKKLHEAGVRGIRFNLYTPGTTTIDMVRPLAGRITPLGWHVQVNVKGPDLLDTKATWSDLPCPVVFDHLAHVPEPNALDHPAFALVRDWMQKGKAWVKLSGFYNDTKVGPPSYSDSVLVARAFAREAPERVVWGSDWPHPTEKQNKPDDAVLLDCFAEAVPEEAARQRILVDNPAKLYQFT